MFLSYFQWKSPIGSYHFWSYDNRSICINIALDNIEHVKIFGLYYRNAMRMEQPECTKQRAE